MIDLKKQVLMLAERQEQRIGKDDYYVNGLLYCGMCHTPKQHKHIFKNGMEVVHFCLCACQMAAAQQKREAAEREKEFQRLKNLKMASIQDKKLLAATFANDDGKTPKMNVAKRYVKKWKEMQEENIGMLLYGDVGSGKTYFAGCIANALMDDSKTAVLMTNFTRLVNQLSEFGMDKNAVLKDLNRYSLLVIDDLGVERESSFVLEQVYNIINSRYNAGLPLIITTNIPISEIKNPKDMNYKRIYDRILENCVPIEFTGSSRRQQINKDKIQKAKKILFQEV